MCRKGSPFTVCSFTIFSRLIPVNYLTTSNTPITISLNSLTHNNVTRLLVRTQQAVIRLAEDEQWKAQLLVIGETNFLKRIVLSIDMSIDCVELVTK